MSKHLQFTSCLSSFVPEASSPYNVECLTEINKCTINDLT